MCGLGSMSNNNNTTVGSKQRAAASSHDGRALEAAALPRVWAPGAAFLKVERQGAGGGSLLNFLLSTTHSHNRTHILERRFGHKRGGPPLVHFALSPVALHRRRTRQVRCAPQPRNQKRALRTCMCVPSVRRARGRLLSPQLPFVLRARACAQMPPGFVRARARERVCVFSPRAERTHHHHHHRDPEKKSQRSEPTRRARAKRQRRAACYTCVRVGWLRC